MIAQKAQVFRKSTFSSDSASACHIKNKSGSTISFSHKNDCSLSSSVNLKKIRLETL
jgi:hypothetical protein